MSLLSSRTESAQLTQSLLPFDQGFMQVTLLEECSAHTRGPTKRKGGEKNPECSTKERRAYAGV
jgi:hypothetical protein